MNNRLPTIALALLFVGYHCHAKKDSLRSTLQVSYGYTFFWEKVKVKDLDKFNELNPTYNPEYYEMRVKENTTCLRLAINYSYRFHKHFYLQTGFQFGRIGTASFSETSNKEQLKNPNFILSSNPKLPYWLSKKSVPTVCIQFPLGFGLYKSILKIYHIRIGVYTSLLTKIYKNYDLEYYPLDGVYSGPSVRHSEQQTFLYARIDPNKSYIGSIHEYNNLYTSIYKTKKEIGNVDPEFKSLIGIPLNISYSKKHFIFSLNTEYGITLFEKEIFPETYPSYSRLYFFNWSMQIGFRI